MTVNVLTTGLPPVVGVNVIVSRTCSVLPRLNARLAMALAATLTAYLPPA